MKQLIFLSLFLLLSGVTEAASINCNTLWAKGYPDPRFPEGLDCTFSEKWETSVGTGEVYHYTKGFPLSPDDTGFTFRAREVFKAVSDKVLALREESSIKLYFKPLTFIFTDQKAIKNEIAMVRVGHAGDDESCPIIVYIDSFKKQTPERQQQMLAHEIFHCIQDTIWREKIIDTPKRAHEWWSEGSAVWFSNLVYPKANQEFDYNDDYMGNSPLVLQKEDDSYGTYLFFQSFSQGWIGNDAVLSMIEDMPEEGGTADQFSAVLDYPSIELHFHRFAQEVTSNRVKDADGAFMATSLSTLNDSYKVKEGENNFEWFNEILTIRITDIQLPPQTIVTVDNVSDPDSTVNPMDMRATGTVGEWNPLIVGYPSTVDMSCKAFPKSIDILSSYAGSDPTNEKFKLKIKAEKATCQCVEKVEFDKCLVGDYELDKPSLDKVFARIFNHKDYVVENSSGSYTLSVNPGQKFTFTETDFNASVIIKDDEHGDIRVLVTMNGSTDAQAKLLSKNEICFSDIGSDYAIRIQVFFPMGVADSTNPYSNFDEFAQGSTKFRCNKDELVLIRMLPTGPDGEDQPQELRFIRK